MKLAIFVGLFLPVLLLPNGALNAKNSNEALCAAVARGNLSAIKNSLGKGVDVSSLCSIKGEAYSHAPLLLAVMADRLDIAAVLLGKGADPNTEDELEGRYIRAHPTLTEVKSARMAQLLVQHKADPNYFADDGTSPLAHLMSDADGTYSTSIENRDEAAKIAVLLLAAGAKPDLPDREGMTALHHAAETSDAPLARILLERKANPNALDKLGRSPLDYALKAKATEVARLLNGQGGSASTFATVDPRRVRSRASSSDPLWRIGLYESRIDGHWYRGTAFMVSPCLIVTNRHVITGNRTSGSGFFLHELSVAETFSSSGDAHGQFFYGSKSDGKGFAYKIDAHPVGWGREDWALARLDQCDSDTNPAHYLQLAPRAAHDDLMSALVTQGNSKSSDKEKADAQKILDAFRNTNGTALRVSYSGYPADKSGTASVSLDDVQLYGQDGCFIDEMYKEFTCQSAHGASGSPVYIPKNDRLEVVSLLWGSPVDNVDTTGELQPLAYGINLSRIEIEDCHFRVGWKPEICGELRSMINSDFQRPMNAALAWCSLWDEGAPELVKLVSSCDEAISHSSVLPAAYQAQLFYSRAKYRIFATGIKSTSSTADLLQAAQRWANIDIEQSTSTSRSQLCFLRALGGFDTEVMLNDCNEGVRLAPNSTTMRQMRAFAELRLGKNEEAVADFDVAIKANESPDGFFCRGVALLRLGRNAEGHASIAAAEKKRAEIGVLYGALGFGP